MILSAKCTLSEKPKEGGTSPDAHQVRLKITKGRRRGTTQAPLEGAGAKGFFNQSRGTERERIMLHIEGKRSE